MKHPISNAARINAVFDEIAAHIRREEHNDASIIRMIADIIPHNASFASFFASNVAAILDGHTESVDYVEVVVEAYRRTLIPVPGSMDFTLDVFGNDPERAEGFLHSMKLHSALADAHIVRNTLRYLN